MYKYSFIEKGVPNQTYGLGNTDVTSAHRDTTLDLDFL